MWVWKNRINVSFVYLYGSVVLGLVGAGAGVGLKYVRECITRTRVLTRY